MGAFDIQVQMAPDELNKVVPLVELGQLLAGRAITRLKHAGSGGLARNVREAPTVIAAGGVSRLSRCGVLAQDETTSPLQRLAALGRVDDALRGENLKPIPAVADSPTLTLKLTEP